MNTATQVDPTISVITPTWNRAMIIKRISNKASNIFQNIAYLVLQTLAFKHIPIWALAAHYKLDKLSSFGYHDYISIYSRYFSQIRNDIRLVLEIGVGVVESGQMAHAANKGYKTGNSLRFWRDYFPHAEIIGADIFQTNIAEERIKTLTCDQGSKESMTALLAMIDNKIDIIIDDGSHKYEDQINTFVWLFNKLSTQGVYIIEDVQSERVSNFNSFSNIPTEVRDKIQALFDLELIVGKNNANDCVVVYRKKLKG